MRSSNSTGVSEVAAQLLIVILVVVLAIVAYAAFSGTLNSLFVKKSVYVAGTAATVDIPQGTGAPPNSVLTFLAKAGDPFYLTGQTQGISGAHVTLKALSPDGKILIPDASSLNGSPYGQTLYLYPNSSPASTQCDYAISTTQPTGSLRPMVLGTWTIQLVDEDVHVLADSYTTKVTHGSTALPVAGGFIGGSTSEFYRTDCTPINQSSVSITTTNTGPGNMSIAHFNGASSNITIPNDPTLSFNGNNMAISMWFDPTTNTTYNPSGSNWYQLIGKGVTNSAGSGSGNENDNYQLFQLGNQLCFEWNDAVTGQHYQAITTTQTVQATGWNYAVVSITNGQLNIYNNGVLQPVSYYNSNVPFTSPVGTQTVNLINNNNAVTIGMQNAASPSNAFYYSGDMGAISLYNRGLTPAEIAANYAGYIA
ncbi:MAG: LamG-like jellyroll fold domain-containing protein [Methanoregula sp.]